MTDTAQPSLAGPALTIDANGYFYLAWTDRNTQRINVMQNGFDANLVGGETTLDSPALAFHNGQLYLAWTGEDDARHLNVMRSKDDGRTWTDKQTLPYDVSSHGPALCSYLGKLYMAYTGTNSRIYIISSPDGVLFDPNSRIPVKQTSIAAPAIGARTLQDGENQFFLAWTGSDSDHHINLHYCFEASFTELDNPQQQTGLDDTSPSGPALAVTQDELILIYRGYAGDHLYGLGAGESTVELTGRTRFADTSRFGPAIAKTSGSLASVAWTGTDSGQSVNYSYLNEMRTLWGDL